jgi:hypothetical protein
MAKLIRDRDGEGFCGSRVDAIDPISGKVVGHEPMIGFKLLVGSITAGTFSDRDWWCTTKIEEIVTANEKEIKFRTKNSLYTFVR